MKLIILSAILTLRLYSMKGELFNQKNKSITIYIVIKNLFDTFGFLLFKSSFILLIISIGLEIGQAILLEEINEENTDKIIFTICIKEFLSINHYIEIFVLAIELFYKLYKIVYFYNQ